MTKKILTLFLTITLLLSSIPAAFAAKKEEVVDNTQKNIYELWGDFEHEESRFKVLRKNNSIAWIEGGAQGSEHCLQLSNPITVTGDLFIPLPGVLGESYDISFYIKSENKTPTSIHIYAVHPEGGWTGKGNYTITQDWTKISFTFDCKDKNDLGTTVTGINSFAVRFNDPGLTDKVYFDKLEAYPHGKVAADYSDVNINIYGITEDPAAPERAIEAENVKFSDVTNHWAKDAIESLAKYDYINGIGDGLYSPETNVTRAQFLKMVADLYKIRIPEYDGRFADVTGNEWYAEPIFMADKLGLINEAMKADGNIYPDQAITREEAASIAAIVAKDKGAQAVENAVSSFADEAQISSWAKDGVKNAASYGMINGYEDGTYKPKNNITRAEAAQILFRIVEVFSKMNIYVDAEIGDDSAAGTQAAPLKTITAARDMAAKFAPTMQNDITIRIRGKQYLSETFKLDETHSGQNGYSIVYTSWGDEKATLTMAKEYSDFQLHDAEKNIWKTYVGAGTYTRQAYFNDVKGIRSRNIGYLKNAKRVGEKYFLCDNTELLDFKYPNEMDMVFHVLWVSDRVLIDSITQEEDGRIKVTPNKRLGSCTITNTYASNGNRSTPSYIENAYELLDEKGEWYLNKHDGFMYYIPRVGEDMSTMVCKLPLGEEMIYGGGSVYEKPLSNIAFDNIIFEGTTWLYPDREGGFATTQANYLYQPNDKGKSAAAVRFEKCQNIKLTNNIFRQLGFTGLDVVNGSRNVDIIGNEFYDISSTAMLIDDHRIGKIMWDDEFGGSPYKRSQETWCEYINITNNYIHDVARDYHGGAGVTISHPRHTKFSHNEVSNTPYSGLHVGWGWGLHGDSGTIMYDLEISYNYIHDVMNGRVNDGAAIYTLGAGSTECEKTNTEKNNRIIGNYLTNGWSCHYVYPDEGSANWYITNNVSDSSLVKEWEYNFDREPLQKNDQYWLMMHASSIKWITLENNYADVDYSRTMMNQRESVVGPTTVVKDGNWPDEARQIMNNAGIEPEYRDKFNLDTAKVLVCDNKWNTLPLETPTESGLMILGDNGQKYSLADYNTELWVEDDAVTLDPETGMLTAHKVGTYEAEAVATINGITQTFHMMLDCGTDIETITIGASSVELITGFKSSASITGLTAYGKQFDITKDAEVDIKSLDNSMATIEKSEDGSKLTMIGFVGGETRFVGTVKYEGKTFELDVPVLVKEVKFGSEEALTLPYREINLQAGWKNGGIPDNGGTKFGGSPNHYMTEIKNELVAFDVSIDPATTWPTLAFCDNNVMGDYTSNDCYMYGFKETYLEVQKFVGGRRTMFFGHEFSPIAGPGVPNLEGGKIYEYNKRFSVIMGALDTPQGTRLILTINGKNIIDYIDTTASKIKASGYMVIYNPEPGGMTFYPFSDIKAE